MFLTILIFLLSLIPTVLIIVWMFKRHKKEDISYRRSAKSFLIGGLISVLPILAISGTFFFVNKILTSTVLKDMPVLIYQLIYDFIVLALAEELVKFFTFKIILNKRKDNYSWMDIISFMVIIGAAFGFVEDIPYAIGADPITMLVRGFTMGHVAYALIMGYLYAKGLKTKKNIYKVLAFLIPWIMHGIYDYSLTPELIELNDNFAFIGISMALIDVILLIILIVFFAKEKKHGKEKYTEPIILVNKEETIINNENNQ